MFRSRVRSLQARLPVLTMAACLLLALCALGGLIGRLVRALVTVGGLDLIKASLLGALCSSLVVIFIADRLRWPAVPASVMGVLPMVPGYFAITGLHALLSFAASGTADPAQLTSALHALALAHFISIALVVGVIGPVILLQRERSASEQPPTHEFDWGHSSGLN